MAFCITNITVVDVLDDSPGATCLTVTSSNINITRGSTFNMLFNLQTQTTAEDGTVTTSAADLTGQSVKMEIKQTVSSTTDLLFASVSNRMISIDYTAGRVTVELPVKHTSRLPLGSLYYCIKLIATDGNTQKIIKAIATVSD